MPLILGVLLGTIAYFVARDLAAKKEKEQNQNQLPPAPGQQVQWGQWPPEWQLGGQSPGWPQFPQNVQTAGRNAAYKAAVMRTSGACCGSCADGGPCNGCG